MFPPKHCPPKHGPPGSPGYAAQTDVEELLAVKKTATVNRKIKEKNTFFRRGFTSKFNIAKTAE
jgi:hypothetical protein